MNHRDFKKFTPGTIAHIYNRGNNREKIFHDEQDCRAFLFRLGLCLGFEDEELNMHKLTSIPYSRIRITEGNRNSFKLYAFSLIPNHFHILIEQVGEISISKLITKLCSSYSKYRNKKYGRVGHTFQDCFKAVLIESNEQLMWVSNYIHTNAVKDGIVQHPKDYTWSSYNDYAFDRNWPIITNEFLLGTFGDKKNFIKQNSYVKETL